MLKLRDNVNFKELEKYGFEESNNCYSKKVEEECCEIIIWKDIKWTFHIPRGIYIYTTWDNVMIREIELLYDLIKDGLVEKTGL